jgi:hypothetical protein
LPWAAGASSAPWTGDEQLLELTPGESIALRDFIAERITTAANELDQGVAYSGICDGDAEALEAVMAKTAIVAFYQRVLMFNLGFAPSLPELLLDERGVDLVETAAAYGECMLERFGGMADPLDEHDWTTPCRAGRSRRRRAVGPGITRSPERPAARWGVRPAG